MDKNQDLESLKSIVNEYRDRLTPAIADLIITQMDIAFQLGTIEGFRDAKKILSQPVKP